MHASDVGVQVGLLSEQRRAEVALVRLLARVDPLVVLEPIGRGKFLVANLALEPVFPSVQNNVVVQLSFFPERRCAVLTLKRLFFGVVG